ncbi:hypothetical protein KK062_10200 [Fulvivirgaceae bacterium PWU5]|uniref:Uncharacterized protein n=1 Tax=Dawidia cretensis TaxID=2782350 RepID=A0AAP2GTS8_9BACT|nr:hypothetical protein [Dawidia cretensis]MBT1708598.1 hypothetical protein [Dawidia cretensis]
MDAPITSEINIETGMVLKEIATGRLFLVGERLLQKVEVAGEDTWRITPTDAENPDRSSRVLTRQELSERYFAEVEE